MSTVQQEEQLRSAAERGDVGAVERLLDDGVDVDAREESTLWAHLVTLVLAPFLLVVMIVTLGQADLGSFKLIKARDGSTALHKAAAKDRRDVVGLLLTRQAHVDAQNYAGATPLHLAAKEGHVQIIQLLHANGANVDAKRHDGSTALHEALSRLHQTPSFTSQLKELRDQLSSAIEIKWTAKTQDESTAVGADPSMNVVETIRVLLDCGAMTEVGDNDGVVPLHRAASDGRIDIVRLLLEHGASVDAKRCVDWKAAVAPSGTIVCSRLLEWLRETISRLPVVLNARSETKIARKLYDGSTPLHLAASRGHLDVVRLLLQHGAAIDARRRNGTTTLNAVAGNGHIDVVRVLLKHDANVNAKDHYGWTPLRRAALHGRVDVVRLLLAHDALVDAKSDDGSSALFSAAVEGHADIVRLLIDGRASVSVNDKNGDTALDVLVANDQVELGKLLSSAFLLYRAGGRLQQTVGSALARSKRSLEALNVIRMCLELWQRQRHQETEIAEIPEEVLSGGATSIQTYISALTVSTASTYRHRICVVGPTTWGKTSLIKTLTRGACVLEAIDKRTVGIDVFVHPFESIGATGRSEKHELNFWDFAGQAVYHTAHAVFFSRRTVFLLVVDLKKYEEKLAESAERDSISEPRIKAFVDETILHWLRLIFTRLPEATVLFVATKMDCVQDTASISLIQSDLAVRVRAWCDEQPGDSVGRGSAAATWFQRQQTLVTAVDTWLTSSSADAASIATTRQRLQERIVACKKGFAMPDSYASVRDMIRSREAPSATSLSDRVRSIFVMKQDVLDWLTTENPSLYRQGCEAVLRTLHDLGDILWYDESQVTGSLKTQTCLSPQVIIHLVREIISHELFELESALHGQHSHADEDDESIKRRQAAYRAIRNNRNFELWHRRLVESGWIDNELIRKLPLWKELSSAEVVLALKCLLQHLGLAYPADDASMQRNSSLIIPAYWKMREDKSAGRNTRGIMAQMDLSVNYSAQLHEYRWDYEFHGTYFPPTLFERVVASGSLPFDQVAPDNSYGAFESIEVMIKLFSSVSPNDCIGYVKCYVSCTVTEEVASAA
ncbi:hypothetical protein ATCC90586_003260 [Pythium insidiosum]|nr:hypothetical protein ATCC90586_003260 [Pythium insidiosum]